MASISTNLPLDAGHWEVHITPHRTQNYAHLGWHGPDVQSSFTLGALSLPEVMDLLEACRVAIEHLRTTSHGPVD